MIAQAINQAHHARQEVLAGELLHIAKVKIPRSRWIAWINTNLAFSPTTASRYMCYYSQGSRLDLPGEVLDWAPPDCLNAATSGMKMLQHLAAFCSQNDPEYVAGGVMESEAAEIADLICETQEWTRRLSAILDADAVQEPTRQQAQTNAT